MEWETYISQFLQPKLHSNFMINQKKYIFRPNIAGKMVKSAFFPTIKIKIGEKKDNFYFTTFSSPQK